ncbi:MAG TPA: hypothetical protein VGK81_05215 [Anaerolineae bacterium]
MQDHTSFQTANRLSRLLNRLRGQGATRSAAPAKPPAPLRPIDSSSFSPRVLLINIDPIVDPAARQTLSQRRRWNSVDDLIGGYIADIKECSRGIVQYQVVERRQVDGFPSKADGFTYTAQNYLDVLDGRARAHQSDWVDYQRIAADFNLYSRIASGEIDEVWLFGFPYAGFYESRMAGAGAFFCNAPILENSEGCPRRFVIMGFNYERGVGEMLESFGHRVESMLWKVYEQTEGEANMWERFTRYDKAAPGLAEVGSVHFAPNSARDYDWGNARIVPSRCDDWYNYPYFSGLHRMVNCAEWGDGDIRAHHKWWLHHLPGVAGSTNGTRNNWWAYVADPNNVVV